MCVCLSVTEVSLIREKTTQRNAAEVLHYHRRLRRAFVGVSARLFVCEGMSERVS